MDSKTQEALGITSGIMGAQTASLKVIGTEQAVDSYLLSRLTILLLSKGVITKDELKGFLTDLPSDREEFTEAFKARLNPLVK
jgi:hypothetical protein